MVLNIKNDRVLFKYNYLWSLKSKGRGSNLQEEVSHIYFRLF